jgi:hypothetical protein
MKIIAITIAIVAMFGLAVSGIAAMQGKSKLYKIFIGIVIACCVGLVVIGFIMQHWWMWGFGILVLLLSLLSLFLYRRLENKRA